MTLRNDFKAAIKRWLEKQWDFKDTILEITEWIEEPGYGGGCDTCGYGADTTRVMIYYTTPGDSGIREYRSYRYEGIFGELLTQLLEE